jgi:hypothetical protein
MQEVLARRQRGGGYGGGGGAGAGGTSGSDNKVEPFGPSGAVTFPGYGPSQPFYLAGPIANCTGVRCRWRWWCILDSPSSTGGGTGGTGGGGWWNRRFRY